MIDMSTAIEDVSHRIEIVWYNSRVIEKWLISPDANNGVIIKAFGKVKAADNPQQMLEELGK